ncbi:hypothetical protein GH714_038663 [Hevea brasiliensis]|uniref:Cytochrome P450 n=1 Tax=Hevea brasiliensis TaxID=3981 RepID=A0A6A6KNZ9_HEVBR|nr:hypothetical protein GH714_038663 [Hevea brasiliensis]
MTLWLGSMCTVVISSDEVARQMFKNHDVVLAGRKIYEAMKGDYGNEGSIITAQYGAHWRMLRRICTTEFFVTSRLDAMRGVRSRCIDRMVQFIEEAGGGNCTKAIDVGRFFFLMSFNLIGNLMFSKDLLDPQSERGAKFFYHAGKRRMKSMDNGGSDEEKRKDFLDVLLEFRGDGPEEPSTFSSRTINVIVFVRRDPKTWEDPLAFKPDRFLEPNMVDYKGHHFEFIPFGSGRRMCPAMPLASRVLPLALGSLLYSFDWVLADGIKAEDMDMSERMGITLRKSVPLKALPMPYKGYKNNISACVA